MEYLIYILVGWGIVDFLVNGSILNKIRSYALVKIPLLGEFLSCVRCTGFWAGVLLGISPFSVLISNFLITSDLNILKVVFSGFLISGSSIIINGILVFLYSRRLENNTTDENEKN